MSSSKQPPSTASPHRVFSARESSNALSRLQADHKQLEQLFDRYDEAPDAMAKQQLVNTICEELTVLTALEEVYFYPIAQEVLVNERYLVDKALIEHAVMKWLFEQLEAENPNSPSYDAKVAVLRENFLQHVREENLEIFPKLRSRLPYLNEFGDRMHDAQLEVRTRLLH